MWFSNAFGWKSYVLVSASIKLWYIQMSSWNYFMKPRNCWKLEVIYFYAALHDCMTVTMKSVYIAFTSDRNQVKQESCAMCIFLGTFIKFSITFIKWTFHSDSKETQHTKKKARKLSWNNNIMGNIHYTLAILLHTVRVCVCLYLLFR